MSAPLICTELLAPANMKQVSDFDVYLLTTPQHALGQEGYDGKGWYFFDMHASCWHGPFSTRDVATELASLYRYNIHG